MKRKSYVSGRFILIFLGITALLWVVDSSGLLRAGWRLLPKPPAPLLRAERLNTDGFYGYSISVETAGQNYICYIYGDESCTWEPIEARPQEDAFSEPFTAASAECDAILPLAARLRLGEKEVTSCATIDLLGEFFSTHSVAVIADSQGDLWVYPYGYSLPQLLCIPIPFGLPLLITVIITVILNSLSPGVKEQTAELPKPEQ